jgi:hypothetical protein
MTVPAGIVIPEAVRGGGALAACVALGTRAGLGAGAGAGLGAGEAAVAAPDTKLTFATSASE